VPFAAGAAIVTLSVLASRVELPAAVRSGVGAFTPLALLAVLTLAIAAVAARELRGRRSLLSRRPLIVLGEWSFAFYLVHQLVLRVLEIHVPDPLDSTDGRLALILFGYAAATAIAYALFRLVEEPWERRIRRGRRVALPV